MMMSSRRRSHRQRTGWVTVNRVRMTCHPHRLSPVAALVVAPRRAACAVRRSARALLLVKTRLQYLTMMVGRRQLEVSSAHHHHKRPHTNPLLHLTQASYRFPATDGVLSLSTVALALLRLPPQQRPVTRASSEVFRVLFLSA
jgi:hypothetical protein